MKATNACSVTAVTWKYKGLFVRIKSIAELWFLVIHVSLSEICQIKRIASLA